MVFVYLYYFVIKTQFPCILSPRHLCLLRHPDTEHLNRLGDIRVYVPAPALKQSIEVGLLQLTQGGSKVKHQRQSTIVGAAFICVTSHRQKGENGLIWKSGYYFYGLNKNHWVDFYYYRVDVYTHCQHTFLFKQLIKVNLASDDPFKFLHCYTIVNCNDCIIKKRYTNNNYSAYIQINPGFKKYFYIERQLCVYSAVYVGSSLGFGIGLMFLGGGIQQNQQNTVFR